MTNSAIEVTSVEYEEPHWLVFTISVFGMEGEERVNLNDALDIEFEGEEELQHVEVENDLLKVVTNQREKYVELPDIDAELQ